MSPKPWRARRGVSWTGCPFAKNCVVKHSKGQVRQEPTWRVRLTGLARLWHVVEGMQSWCLQLESFA